MTAAGRGRVLIIDDEPTILRAFARMLTPAHEVVTAAGGREALARLAQDPEFDVVICDITMPDVDGVEVITELRRTRPALAARVIVCTGGPLSPATRKLVAAGGYPVLLKPVSTDQLRQIVDDRVAAIRAAVSPGGEDD